MSQNQHGNRESLNTNYRTVSGPLQLSGTRFPLVKSKHHGGDYLTVQRTELLHSSNSSKAHERARQDSVAVEMSF